MRKKHCIKVIDDKPKDFTYLEAAFRQYWVQRENTYLNTDAPKDTLSLSPSLAGDKLKGKSWEHDREKIVSWHVDVMVRCKYRTVHGAENCLLVQPTLLGNFIRFLGMRKNNMTGQHDSWVVGLVLSSKVKVKS